MSRKVETGYLVTSKTHNEDKQRKYVILYDIVYTFWMPGRIHMCNDVFGTLEPSVRYELFFGFYVWCIKEFLFCFCILLLWFS